jgi:hypothetical protein
MIKTTLSFVILVCIVHLQSYSQGAWNIKYVPTSAVDSTFIGKEIRLDFKRNNTDTITGPVKSLPVRKLLSTTDTVKLEIGKDSMSFVEVWKIYPDHGVVSEQYLQCLEAGQSEVWIKEFYIKSISRLYFTLEAVIYRASSQEKRQVWIPKARVKGVLIATEK